MVREMTHITPVNGPESKLPTERTPEDVASLLKRPFASHVVKQRQIAGGRSVDYISIDDIVERLNRACLEWSWHVQSVQIITMPIVRKGSPVDTPVAQVIGTLEIPGLGKRQGIGTSPLEGNEDATKAAASDSLKRAAYLFSVPSR